MSYLTNLIHLLTLNSDALFAKEILDNMNSNLLLSHTELTSANEIYFIYYHRYQLQKKLNHYQVEGYEYLLEQLNTINPNIIVSVYFLRFDLVTYVVVYNKNHLLGILKSKTNKLLKITKYDLIQRKKLGDKSRIYEYLNKKKLGEIN